MEILGSLLFDLWARPRFAIPTLLGIAAGVAVFYLTGKEPASVAMAFGCGLLGLTIGFVLHYFRNAPRDPLD
ncbi:hypothetical protein [Pseudoxanthomonas sp.]|uniref:hypothetical protein n=1 Tax=Pseudoxanthomonas sp. TaxID=1871049 RepID=UPI0025CBCDAD|nr:hypothetical protein [Pseudoxanthomonas sp.]